MEPPSQKPVETSAAPMNAAKLPAPTPNSSSPAQDLIRRAAEKAGLNIKREIRLQPGYNLDRVAAVVLASIAADNGCTMTAQLGHLQAESHRDLSFLFLIVRSRRIKKDLILKVCGRQAPEAAEEIKAWLAKMKD